MLENSSEHQPIAGQKTEVSGLAIWSLVLGILGVPPFPFGFLTGIPALVLGYKALHRIKSEGFKEKALPLLESFWAI